MMNFNTKMLVSKTRQLTGPIIGSGLPYKNRSFSTIIPASIVGFAACTALFFNARYKIAGPDQYLIRTGLFINDIDVSKQGLQLPFQKYQFISMCPRNYTFDLQSMSLEKLEFLLPGVFTIGPKDNPESLVKYVKILAGIEKDDNNKTFDDIILGILEGEVRALSSQMTMEQIFNDRKVFKETIIAKIQEELEKLGMYIYNANIKELQDCNESDYFKNMRQKILANAAAKAKKDIAEAKAIGDIGEKEKEAEARQKIAKLEADTVTKENEMRQQIALSTAELSVTESEAAQKENIARIKSENNSKMKETEMQQEVEQKRILMETEKRRATDVSKSLVDAEELVAKTDGKGKAKEKETEEKSQTVRIKAEATLFAKERDAEATKILAEAALFAKEKEATGILATFEAQSKGLQQMVDSFGGDKDSLVQYLMIENRTYVDLAKENANALQKLNPKITVWNTGTSDTDDYTKTISGIAKLIPPLFSTIHEQTGIKLPDSILKMPNKTFTE